MKSIRLIKPYFLENRPAIVFGIVCLIAVDFFQLFIPRVLKWAVDDLTAFRADGADLAVYALYIAATGLMIGFFRYFWRLCLIGTSRRVEEGLRNRLFFHIQTLSAAYFDGVKTGDLMAHATNDLQHVRMAMGMGLVALTDAVVLGAAAIGFMVYINLKLTLFVLIPMPLIVVGTRFFSKKMHRLYQKVQASFSDLTEVAREHFAGIRIIKAYNRQSAASIKFISASGDYVGNNIRLVRITGSFFPMMLLFSNLSLAVVLFLGGRQTITATITPGDFIAFISYLGLLTWPMMALGWVTNLIQRGTASLDRIDKILKTAPEIDDGPGAISIDRAFGRLFFENVAFAYKSGSRSVLTDINLGVEPGRTVGIVGPPGSGKSTLLSLIPRIYDVTAGRILLDGIDIRKLTLKSLRSRITFMPQEPFLFSGTIRENITLDNARVREDDLLQAVRAAALYDTIQAFPEGFDTLVGEKGIILSGGQKQRIALARALLPASAVLVLDDPISQVDVETGGEIIRNIKALSSGRTIFIVSHRLSAVRFADTILVMDDGRIVESGTHAGLMASGGYYAKTFHLQELEEAYHAD
ncbi:MAG: ABC transporter ATP-binding protein [Desulfobacterales bacterium]|nr:ABC transporter ATP-binding protein [Desulfobacterales bacterium]